jgi:energy-coupling factor transporter ATP-binding protein EcfA2
MRRMAEDLRAQQPTLSVGHSEELAIASILTKRPQLIARCDGCGSEWFE